MDTNHGSLLRRYPWTLLDWSIATPEGPNQTSTGPEEIGVLYA